MQEWHNTQIAIWSSYYGWAQQYNNCAW